MVKYKMYSSYALKSDAQLRAKSFRSRGETAQIRVVKKPTKAYAIYSSTMRR